MITARRPAISDMASSTGAWPSSSSMISYPTVVTLFSRRTAKASAGASARCQLETTI